MKRPSIADVLAGRAPLPSQSAAAAPTPKPAAAASLPATVRPADSPRSVRDLVDLDRIDLPERLESAGWVLVAPPVGPCERHGHGAWWEHRDTGELHCVACWPNPPLRSWFRCVWTSEAAGEAHTVYFAVGVGDSLFYIDPQRQRWPWRDDPAPAEAVF